MKDPGFLAKFGINVNVPMAEYTAIGVGGNADFFVAVSEPEVLRAVLAEAGENGLKTVVIGSGSNIVFSDHGYRGLVIKNEIRSIKSNKTHVTAGGGLLLADLVSRLAENDYGGLEALAGYPGSVGGAVWNNARADGIAVGNRLISATLYSKGRLIEVEATDMQFAPQDSRPRHTGEFVVTATFKIRKKDPDDIKKAMLQVRQHRLRTEPVGARSIRVFRDNKGRGKLAAELAKRAGLAGEKVGGAMISAKHPNFIINQGTARASDVYELAQRIKNRVSVKLGEKLREQVVWVGER